MTLNQLKNNRPTIAVLTNMMATPFSEGIIFGAADYAKQNDYNVLCFTGAEFAKPAPVNMSRHRIFDIIDTDLIDGVILPMGALSRFISHEQQLAFLEQFSHLPVITIASDIPGYKNVGYSPRQGMHQLVSHLVNQHGVQRFAFAGATGVHRSTMVKKQFFIEALEAHRIHFKERMFITSDMRRNAPIPELKDLFLGDKQEWPQAIVCGTDNQARDITSALKRMGLRVPEDIIVTGSMGNVESLFADPPLTSIVEPTYELGWHAAERIIAAIENRPYADDLILPTSIVVRRSCGCNRPGDCEQIVAHSFTKELESNSLSVTEMVRLELKQVIDAAPPALKTTMAPELDHQLANLLVESLKAGHPEALVSQFHLELERTVRVEEIYLWGQLALSIHRLLVEGELLKEARLVGPKIASSLFQIVQNCYEKSGRYRSFEAERYVGILREIGIQLNSEFNPDEICQLLSGGLNIHDCYISIFDELNHKDGLVRSVMATRDGQQLQVSDQLYPATQLLPPEAIAYDEPFALLVMPLSFKEDFLGISVLSMGERRGIVYEGLLTHFSSALKNRMHMRHLVEAEKKFSDIAHSASDWLWEIDTESRFQYSSGGVERVLGYHPQEMLDKPLFIFLEQPDPFYAQKLLQTMSCQDGLVLHESHYKHKDGSIKVLATTGRPVLKHGRVVGYRGAFKDITKIKEQEARIRTLAYRDPLTDLPNRTLFDDRLNTTVATAQRTKAEFAVLFVDLDGFKLVNDSMGHHAGDLLLVEAAKLFTKCIREGDTLARFGGDEFVVLLPNIEKGIDAAQVADRMINALSAPIQVRDQSFYITASIGISVFPADGKTAETLLRRADKSMYHSKRTGKNRFSFYEHELGEAVKRDIMIRNYLYTAVREEGFHLLFQPQVDEKTRQVTGVESLIRLSEQGGLNIGPAEFIPLAEEVGLIDQIGLWVFRSTCQQQRLWADAGHKVKCSVNVSARQFRNPNLADDFINVLQETGANPEMLVIEITENAVIDNDDTAYKILQKLSDHGLKVAIDDFGTGYASLSCLRKMPIDILKIDRSFVNDCITNEENASIIEAILMMAKSLNLETIAEGVETNEQLSFLGNLGCDQIQGYLFSKPIPESQIATLVQSRFEPKH